MPTLNWIGKDKVVNYHLKVPYHVLERKYSFDEEGQHEEYNGSENMIIHGDNLLALKSLLPKYEGKIKCIYIDPPYNTGNEGWVYNDNVNDPRIKKWLGEVVGKEGEDLSRHDKWLCMMYPRLRLLQKLLAEDGAIFISIDDNEQANLKEICDEIFGARNFVDTIIWQKRYSPQNAAKWFSESHDFILVYAKNKDIWHPNLLERSAEMNARYSNRDHDIRGPWKAENATAQAGHGTKGQFYVLTAPNGKKHHLPAGRCWVYTEPVMKEMIKDNRVWFGEDGNNVPAIKRFLSEVKQGMACQTIWMYTEVGHNQEGKKEIKSIFPELSHLFETPKPSRLIDRIIELATNSENDIVLDSFAGSGTTAHSVLKANHKDGGTRRFILVETEDYAENLTAKRVKRVIKGYEKNKKMETVLKDENLTVRSLRNGTQLYADACLTQQQMKDKYDKVNIKLVNNHLQVIGITKAKEEIKGTGGNFSYYELGQPLMKDGFLNEAVGEKAIRQYVYFMDTKENRPEEKAEEPYFLGKHLDTAYYFFYKKDETTTLDYELLSTVKTKAESYVMYADSCLLSQDELMNYHITFKKIPRDIARL